MSIEDKHVIFIFGGPGSGKGTQGIAISKQYGFGYASAGDVLRAEIANPNSAHGKEIDAIIKSGKLVPPEFLVGILKNAIQASEHKYFLLDGFPRSTIQDEVFCKEVCNADCSILIDVPTDVLIQRVKHRALTSGRPEDDDSVIPKRIESHHRDTQPVIEKYKKEGKLITIDGNQSIEKVRESFVAVLRKYWEF